MNPPVYALLPPGVRVVEPTAVTIVVPFSNIAPRTVPGTVTENETAVPAVVPTVESSVGIFLLWLFGRRGGLSLVTVTFVWGILLCRLV